MSGRTGGPGPRVSIVVVAFNSRPYLGTCLSTLLAQDYPSFEVILVDNASDDGGPEEVERLHPEVRVIRSGSNLHYTGGNNLGFAAAGGELIGSINPDTEVASGWLSALVEALDSNPAAGLVTSRVCLYKDRDRLNTCGNVVHLSGLGFCRGLGEPVDSYPEATEVPAISGAAFLARRSLLEEIGGFDETFTAYVEDTDLSLRAALAGYSVIYAPASVAFHDYTLRMRPEKFYLLERNRQLPLRKVLDRRTLLLLSPALVLGDLMTLVFALRGGPAYLGAWRRARRWRRENRHVLEAGRRAAQSHRRVTDRHLLRRLSTRLPVEQLGLPLPLARPVARLASAMFALAAAPARLLAR